MSWPLFDRIRAYARSAGLYTQDRLYQDQTTLSRLSNNGELMNFSSSTVLLDQTNLQINRLERYKDYEQMDEVGEISLALDLYADDISLVDPERKHTLIIKSAHASLKRELEEFFYQKLLIDNNLRPIARYLCKYGDFPGEIVPNKDRNGVAALKFMNVYNFTRVETKFGDLVGFYYQDEITQQPTFLHPWQTVHMRLTSYENIFHPMGKAVIEGGRKAFKQLRLMEDAALIHRITRAPLKRIFEIPVGNIPVEEISEYIQMVARQFKNQRFYDQRTGTFNERFAPLIQEDDFFLPRRPDGSGPQIHNLEGAENLDQIKDIEYFKKKMIAPTKIPFARVGIGDSAGEANDKSLATSHVEFAKAVQWIQREIASGLTKVAICHLAMAGYPIRMLKEFTITLSATNSIDELYRIETWSSRAGVMNDLKDLGWFPSKWIIERFTDLSPDEIVQLDNDKEANNDDEQEGGGGGGALGGIGGLGGDDLGGDMAGSPDEMGGMPDAEGEGGELEAPPGESDATKLDTLVNSMGEAKNINGYDSDIELKMLIELRDVKQKRIRAKTLVKPIEHNNGFKYLFENNEFDGLQDSNGEVIVKPSIDGSEAVEVLNEYKKILCADVIVE